MARLPDGVRILTREASQVLDPDYTEALREALGAIYSNPRSLGEWIERFSALLAARSYRTQGAYGQLPQAVVGAVRDACVRSRGAERMLRGALDKLEAIPADAEPESLVELLGAPDWQSRWAARMRLLDWRAAAMDALIHASTSDLSAPRCRSRSAYTLEEVALLARSIAQGRPDGYVCSRCFRRSATSTRAGPVSEIVAYPACRACGRTRHLEWHPGPIVCVLDSTIGPDPVRSGDSLRVNWLARARANGFRGQEVFDFDTVEIVSATDTEVEHFCVDVTSDTDRDRRKRYRHMECRVHAGCMLGSNAVRQLESVFGSVVST